MPSHLQEYLDWIDSQRDRMISRLDQMTPGDMPDFEPALKLSLAGFSSVPNAATKHMIVISDGDPSPPRQATLARLKSLGVQITTVAVGTHGPAGSTPLQRIATSPGPAGGVSVPRAACSARGAV